MKNNTVIFGDSYSTFKGYIPDGYAVYYSEEERPETDVRSVTETWWHKVMIETNSNLVLNNSWSGSTICYTGYNNTDCSKSSSFIYRFEKLLEDGFFEENKIDTVFIFGGTNDTCADAPIGELMFDNFQKSDLYSVLPAICYFFKKIKDNLQNTKIYCLINTGLKPQIYDGMKTACKKYGIIPITFEKIDKRCGHPTIKGMDDIKNQVLNVLNK